ncbi:MAG: head GIN domain-containing protein [Bacteroidota bacterium]
MTNRKYIHIFFALLSLMCFSTCKKENMCDCFKSTGSIVTKTREISGFTKIFVEDNMNVFITEDPSFEVKIETGDNLLSLIKTEVVDGTLFIRNDNKCNWVRSYDKPFNVYIKMPVIEYITSNGTGNIKSLNTLTTDKFDIQTKNSGNIELTINNTSIHSHIHGSADVTLHGITNEHSCSIVGTGYLYCSNLQTKYTWIQTGTIGMCYISATDLLIYRIDQIGNIYCNTRPANIEKTQNGTGQLYLP